MVTDSRNPSAFAWTHSQSWPLVGEDCRPIGRIELRLYGARAWRPVAFVFESFFVDPEGGPALSVWHYHGTVTRPQRQSFVSQLDIMKTLRRRALRWGVAVLKRIQAETADGLEDAGTMPRVIDNGSY